jgi:hypothetical protein
VNQNTAFDEFARALANRQHLEPTRRGMVRALVGAVIGAGVLRASAPVVFAKKAKKHKRKCKKQYRACRSAVALYCTVCFPFDYFNCFASVARCCGWAKTCKIGRAKRCLS